MAVLCEKLCTGCCTTELWCFFTSIAGSDLQHLILQMNSSLPLRAKLFPQCTQEANDGQYIRSRKAGVKRRLRVETCSSYVLSYRQMFGLSLEKWNQLLSSELVPMRSLRKCALWAPSHAVQVLSRRSWTQNASYTDARPSTPPRPAQLHVNMKNEGDPEL